MKVLILDSRIIYELAFNRNINQFVVKEIIDELDDRYELRVSCLVEKYLNGFTNILSEKKIKSIINAFSDFFFDIDQKLLERLYNGSVSLL